MERAVEFSIVKKEKVCVRKQVSTFAELARYASTDAVSFGIFKHNTRRTENFLRADTIGLDIDDGMSLDDAKELFKDYKHAILTTKSHQKEKNGVVADRFRVVLQLERAIDNAKDFYATWYNLYEKFPFIDKQCKDPSRQFYASPQVVVIKEEGQTVPVIVGVDKPKQEVVNTYEQLGQLSARAMKLLLFGAPAGSRHGELYFAGRDAHEQGYTEDQFAGMIEEMIQRGGDWGTTTLSGSDRKKITSIFKEDPRHPPRETEKPVSAFKWTKLSDVAKGEDKLEWTVGGLLIKGGLSIMAGPPKSGKSTLTRQLTRSILSGDAFLGRKATKGKVLYLALEEQPYLLKQQFAKVGVTSDENLLIHVGSIRTKNRIEQLKEAIYEQDATLVVIDTLFLFSQFENGNSYDEVNKKLMDLRDVARDTGAHLLTVHHQNKGLDKGTNSISGSSAIHGAVDCAMIFNTLGAQRTLTSSQRGGIQFVNQSLCFDKETETYSLGESNDGF